jgi:hypothetical protein
VKKLIPILLAATLVSLWGTPSFAEGAAPTSKVTAYYFHGDFRCPTCRKLEQYSKEAIENNFKEELTSGKLEFKAVNTETKGNEHYVSDYGLYTKSLVLSLVKDGKEIKSENLTKIWNLVGKKQKFYDYVKEKVNGFLEEL